VSDMRAPCICRLEAPARINETADALRPLSMTDPASTAQRASTCLFSDVAVSREWDAACDVLSLREATERAGFSQHAILRAIRRGNLVAFEPSPFDEREGAVTMRAFPRAVPGGGLNQTSLPEVT
jgi:hypothetical protein